MWKNTERVWGHYRVLFSIPFLKIKYLSFNDKGQLSVQLHHHRSEFWIILFGKSISFIAGRLRADKRFLFIPKFTLHSFKAFDRVGVIEFQFGKIINENDIKRYAYDWWK